jgi:hypothetical protein
MKEEIRAAAPARTAEPRRTHARTEQRITLALLDAYTAGQENRGYDPYNAGNGGLVVDAWRAKPKRR